MPSHSWPGPFHFNSKPPLSYSSEYEIPIFALQYQVDDNPSIAYLFLPVPVISTGQPDMTLASHCWSWINNSSINQLLPAIAALVSPALHCNPLFVIRDVRLISFAPIQIIAYCAGRVIYRLKFHPLSKYPGPTLAAITDLWWAYHR